MTAQIAGTIASVAAVLATACTHFYEIPIETPIRPKLDVSAFQRVLVAGFIAGGSEDVDANVETTRLLRSQLRIKVRSPRDRGGRAAADGSGRAARRHPPPVRQPRRSCSRKKRTSSRTRRCLRTSGYWKQIGEEFQQPLIVTGTVMFMPQERTTAFSVPARHTISLAGG